MKRLLLLMDWSVVVLRVYQYALFAIPLFTVDRGTFQMFWYSIWLVAAIIVPMFFWFPQVRSHKALFSMTDLLFGGTYYVNSVIHPTLTSRADYLLPSLVMGYLMTRRSLWVIPSVFLIPFMFRTYPGFSWAYAFGHGTDNLLFCFIGIWVGFVALSYRQKHVLAAEIEHQNKLLTHYADEVEKLTVLEERSRMSKELHDTLGHSFISLIMGLDSAVALLDRHPADVKARLMRLRALAEQNLDDIRDIVHEMGDADETSLVSQIEALAKRFQENTGTAVTLRAHGVEQLVRFDIRHAALRVVQESFTNALKHGKASALDVELSFSESLLRLSIRNNGKAIDNLAYGFGLTNMQQRLNRIGGCLEVHSSTTGVETVTVVSSEIPLKEVLPNADYPRAHR